MYFDSFADFVAMGTHGPYVWSAYALTLIVVLANLGVILHQGRKVQATIRQKLRRQQLQEQDSYEP
ncbi:Heme exporter protein D [gamma proteobacterium HdN1]|nr:Heme exporter protein D [gamma proteobacterium HdN1]